MPMSVLALFLDVESEEGSALGSLVQSTTFTSESNETFKLVEADSTSTYALTGRPTLTKLKSSLLLSLIEQLASSNSTDGVVNLC